MDRRKILLVLAAVIAALGTMLVWLYVQGADNRAKEQYEAVSVYVAATDIAAGESFTSAEKAGKIVLKDVPKDQLLTGASDDLGDYEGQNALTTIYAGEQLIPGKWGGVEDVDVTSKVLAIPKGKLAITVNLTDPQRVAGFVQPGSEVAIFVSVEPDKTPLHYTRTLVKRATVLGVGDTSTITTTKVETSKEGEESTTEPIPQTLVTLALDQKDAERVIWGSNFGYLALGLVNDNTTLEKTAKVLDSTLVP